MKIFVSWSGERSQLLAQALHEWLPLVLHYVVPWLSQTNIEAGERWANEVAKELENSNFGIICVTRENVGSPWILFEAGALAKSMQGSRVIPVLLDLEFRDITGPLAQFQAKKVESAGLWEIVSSSNQSATSPVPEARVKQLFDALWSELEKKIAAIPKQTTSAKHTRSQPEVLEELVTGVRALDARFRDVLEDSPRFYRSRRRKFHPMMVDEMLHGLELGRRDPTRFLILASLLKDDFPWLYELGVDAYRAAAAGDGSQTKAARHRFIAACKLLRRGPFIDFVQDKESDFAVHRIVHMLEELQFEEPDDTQRAPKRSLKAPQKPASDPG